MGNAFVAGLKNEAPRGGDITDEDRRQRCTKRDAEGSEFSYTYMVQSQLSEGSFVRFVIVQIPKFVATPNPNSNPSLNHNPNPNPSPNRNSNPDPQP